MTKEQAIVYLRFSGFSDEQIKTIEGAFSCPSTGIDCEDCPAYEKKSECEHDHEILKAYSDGASEVLDKVRADIKQAYDDCDITNDYDRGRNYGLYMAMQIIDIYMTEEGKA